MSINKALHKKGKVKHRVVAIALPTWARLVSRSAFTIPKVASD